MRAGVANLRIALTMTNQFLDLPHKAFLAKSAVETHTHTHTQTQSQANAYDD